MARYAKRQVVEAGKMIAGRLPEPTPELIDAFRLAHDWRASHLKPMRRVRDELSRAARKVWPDAVVAARLKRMDSIRRKMQRRPMTLFQMQDIAGARVILDSMESVDRVLDFYRSGASKFTLQREWDYIAEPKASGYRSCHLRMDCPSATTDDAYAHMSVEVQVRTELQHAWATAVEAVGLVTRQDLKSGRGDARWLRVFELMSCELAEAEGRPVVPGTPDTRSRRLELRDLSLDLDAVQTLENYSQAIRAAESFSADPGDLYLIRYDYESGAVSVRAFSRFSRMYERFAEMEREELTGREANTVSVEVDRVDDLRRAYPNYFLDVREFAGRLNLAILDYVPPPAGSERASKWRKLQFFKDLAAGRA